MERVPQGDFGPEVMEILAITTVIFYIVMWVYFIVCELFFSATPGKMAWGLKVVSVTGERLMVRQVFIRNTVRLLDFFPPPQFYLMTLMLVLFTRRRQRGGDLMARTVVVLTR